MVPVISLLEFCLSSVSFITKHIQVYLCFDSANVQVDIAPEFDVNAFSIKYVAPLQYITWRKMFKLLKPGNFPSDVHY